MSISLSLTTASHTRSLMIPSSIHPPKEMAPLPHHPQGVPGCCSPKAEQIKHPGFSNSYRQETSGNPQADKPSGEGRVEAEGRPTLLKTQTSPFTVGLGTPWPL